jgi:large subunit ribosomal protein L17
MAELRKLNKENDERNATLRNIVSGLLWYGRVETTIARAKAAKRIAEKLITVAVREYANDIKVVKKVNDEDKKVKKEFVNDSPSKLAARRKLLRYLYEIPEPKQEKESKFAYKQRVKDVNHPLVEKMFREYGPKYYKRAQDMGTGGGYTRILKKGPRRGDAAEIVILELV